jgi:hypothetical protein
MYYDICVDVYVLLGMMVHAYNPSTSEAEANLGYTVTDCFTKNIFS